MIDLTVQRELKSPNKWNGRHWRYKHRESQEWEQAIGLAFYDTYAKDRPNVMTIIGCLTGPKKWEGIIVGKMRVTVERHAPGLRNFIRDDDNLRFAVKPLLDALKRQGYIRNDSRKWLEHDTPTQQVSADGKFYTRIVIQEVAGESAGKWKQP